MKYLGFGAGLNNKLTAKVKSGKNEFHVRTENQYRKDEVSYKLDFRKSDQSDMCFFNKYAANQQGQKPEEERS